MRSTVHPSTPRRATVHPGAGVALTLSVVGLALPAAAQDQRQIERVLRSVEGGGTFTPQIDTGLTLWERTQFDYGGSLNFNYLNLNQSGGNSARLVQPEADVYARLNLDGVHGFFALAQFNYYDYSAGDSFDGRGDRWIQPSLTRYWYEFDLRRALDAYQRRSSEFNVNVRVGRQFVDWAGGLALSEALYAVKPTVEFDRRNRLEALVGITPDHTADFDASRLNYNTRTRRFYAGALLAHDFERGDEVFAYALAMRDKASEDRARAGFNNVDFYRDSNYYGLGMKGAMGDNWLYYAEAVLQRGRSASDPLFGLQSRDELTAWAARFQLTYVLRDEGDTRFQFELLAASGDDDRRVGNDTVGGNFPGTEDNAFAALSYAFTGTAFAPALTNLLSLRVGAATFPWRTSDTFHDLQVGADVITSFKVSQRGAIEEPTNPDAYLGTEADVYANWRVTSDLTLTGRYGIFVPGSGIAEPNDNRHFIYLGVTLSF